MASLSNIVCIDELAKLVFDNFDSYDEAIYCKVNKRWLSILHKRACDRIKMTQSRTFRELINKLLHASDYHAICLLLGSHQHIKTIIDDSHMIFVLKDQLWKNMKPISVHDINIFDHYQAQAICEANSILLLRALEDIGRINIHHENICYLATQYGAYECYKWSVDKIIFDYSILVKAIYSNNCMNIIRDCLVKYKQMYCDNSAITEKIGIELLEACFNPYRTLDEIIRVIDIICSLTDNISAYDAGLSKACNMRSKELCQYMIDKGADHCHTCYRHAGSHQDIFHIIG